MWKVWEIGVDVSGSFGDGALGMLEMLCGVFLKPKVNMWGEEILNF
jgi:hypothetical protein